MLKWNIVIVRCHDEQDEIKVIIIIKGYHLSVTKLNGHIFYYQACTTKVSPTIIFSSTHSIVHQQSHKFALFKKIGKSIVLLNQDGQEVFNNPNSL
jgi:hypothetical protein